MKNYLLCTVFLLFAIIPGFCADDDGKANRETKKSDAKQTEADKPAYKYDFSFSWGTYSLPKFMLGIGGVKESPVPKGQMKSFTLMRRFGKSRKWGLGVKYVDMQGSGKGLFVNDDSIQNAIDNNIPDLKTTGKFTLHTKGILIEAEKIFGRSSWPVNPYIRFGGGVGRISHTFVGVSTGTSSFSFEDEDGNVITGSEPFSEPATDSGSQLIPLIDIQGGAKIRTNWMARHHLEVDAGMYFNTGKGFLVTPHFVF